MAEGLTFLADVPEAHDGAEDAPARSEVQVAKQGRFRDPRYGRFAITVKDFATWVKNFAGVSRGRIPVDFDHSPEKRGTTEAAGWVVGLNQRGEELWADVEWTKDGAEAVREKRYLFISPSYSPNYKDEYGKAHGTALVGIALTNRPALKMAAVSLSEEIGFAEEQPLEPAATDSPGESDSRNQMPELGNIAVALDLDESADEATVLDAIKNRPEPETKTLEEQASDEGKVVLDADKVAELEQGMSEGKAAKDALDKMRFENAYEKAANEGRVDAKDETRELHEGIYAVDPEKSLKLLETLPKIVNLDGPDGDGGAPASVESEFEGEKVDPERAEELAKAKQLMEGDENLSLMDALERVA